MYILHYLGKIFYVYLVLFWIFEQLLSKCQEIVKYFSVANLRLKGHLAHNCIFGCVTEYYTDSHLVGIS